MTILADNVWDSVTQQMYVEGDTPPQEVACRFPNIEAWQNGQPYGGWDCSAYVSDPGNLASSVAQLSALLTGGNTDQHFVVDDIAARDALPTNTEGTIVLVKDASADPQVGTATHALYMRDDTAWQILNSTGGGSSVPEIGLGDTLPGTPSPQLFFYVTASAVAGIPDGFYAWDTVSTSWVQQ